MPSKGGRQPNLSLKENGAVSLNSKDNVNALCRFFSNFHAQNTTFESKLMKSTISRFEMNL